MDAARTALLEFLMDDDLSSSSSDSSDWGSLDELDDSGLSDLEFEYIASEEQGAYFKKHTKTGNAHSTTKLDDQEFFESYRISRNLAEDLAVKLKDSQFFHVQVGKYGKLDAYDEILMFLWFAGHNAPFRELAQKHNIAISSCHRVIKRTAAFLRSIFDVIKWPEEDEMAEGALFFRRNGLPQAIGAINLTHIDIDKPLKDWEVYKNASNKFSVQLQVICDHNKRIIHMYTGAPGSETVTEVFDGSRLADGLEAACGDFCIMGDDGYPCLRNLIAPYRSSDGDLTIEQEVFNQLLNAGKSLVNDCFAKLKSKFPQLGHCRLRSLNDINNFITACCVLYNLSLDDDFLRDTVAEPPPDHNSHYFLVNADYNERQCDDELTDTTDGVEYRENYVAALKLVNKES